MGKLRKLVNLKGRRFVFLSVMVIIILASCKPEEKNPVLALGYDDVSSEIHEFTLIDRGQTVAYQANYYAIINLGDDTLTVTGISISESEGTSSYSDIDFPCTIEPGEVETFTFSYASGDGTITVASNDPDGDFSFNWSIPW